MTVGVSEGIWAVLFQFASIVAIAAARNVAISAVEANDVPVLGGPLAVGGVSAEGVDAHPTINRQIAPHRICRILLLLIDCLFPVSSTHLPMPVYADLLAARNHIRLTAFVGSDRLPTVFRLSRMNPIYSVALALPETGMISIS